MSTLSITLDGVIKPYIIMGLVWGPLSLVRITEELLEWKSSGSGLENRD
jgi:hypothetical protein